MPAQPMIQLARHALDHPRLWLLSVALLTLILGSGLLRLELRTDGGSLHPTADPVVEISEQDRLRFQDPRQVVVLVSSRPDAPPVASPLGFRFLEEMHRDLRMLSAVRSDHLQSLATLPRLSEATGGFSLGSYLDDLPEDPQAFADRVTELRARTITDGLLLSSDGRMASVRIPLTELAPVAEQVGELEHWLADFDPGPFELRLTGPQVAETTLGRMVLRDLFTLVPIMLVVIALLLYGCLGNLGGIIVPLAEALLVLLWTFGTMGWCGVPVTLVTTILPVVLMAMCITDELHLLERLQATLPGRSVQDALMAALEQVGRPVIATSVTTALGFLSFLSASMTPLRHFGLFTALGLLLAMLLSFCWIPALIAVLPRSWIEAGRPTRRRHHLTPALWLSQLERLTEWIVKRPTLALAIGLGVLGASLPGIFLLRVQDSWVGNFPPDSPLVHAERDFNRHFWGSYRFDVVFEGEPEFFYTPEGVKLVEEFSELAAAGPHVGGVLSYLTPLAEVASALDRPGPMSALSPLMLADLVTLAEMSGNRLSLRELFTHTGDAIRAQIFVKDPDYRRAEALQRYLDARLPELVANLPVAYHYSGDLPLALAVVSAIVRNQLSSIGWTLLTVSGVLFVFFLRGRAALIAMLPVVAAVAILLGWMGYAGLPLGIATSMFAALTVGVGVDFGIHFLHCYERERSSGLDHGAALLQTTTKTGKALRWNVLVLTVGFLVLAFSTLKPNHSLGILLAAAMLTCYATTLLILPRGLGLLATAVATLLLTLAGAPPPAVAAGPDSLCSAPANPQATEIMGQIEASFRRDPRIVRMAIGIRYRHGHPLAEYFEANPSQKTLWAIVGGNVAETRLLYVFSGPGRLAGTTLLMHDSIDPSRPDATWLYLRSFDSFSKLVAEGQRVMVPGTALTYGDSRGFVPRDKYLFSFVSRTPPTPAEEEIHILACPRSPSISQDLGYGWLEAVIDRRKAIVRRVAYSDLAGKPLKTYEARKHIQIDDRWFPSIVHMEHRIDGTLTDIVYEYWLPETPPPQSLFEPSLHDKSFLERLEQFLLEAGLGDRIGPELRDANALVEAYDERMRRMKSGSDSP